MTNDPDFPLTRRAFTFAASALAVGGNFARAAKAEGGKMKAVQYAEYGVDKPIAVAEVAKPKAEAGQVLIKVHAAGINPIDWKVRNGLFAGLVQNLPIIPGYDVAGEVAEVGNGVTQFKTGDQVYAMLPLTAPGGFAEYVAVAADLVARKPTKASMEQAAGLPLAGLTAYQALVVDGKLTNGQTVLIHGAGGGVGHFAVQIAKAQGATVIGTGSDRSMDFIKALGADKTVNYKTEKFEDVAKDVDLVFDTVGGETLSRSYAVVKKGGGIVSLQAAPDAAEAEKAGLQIAKHTVVNPNGAHLKVLADLVNNGKLNVEVTKTYGLNEAGDALKQSEAGGNHGKLVMKLV